ncbi:MAG TPA: cupredoxin domain-containing protein [Dehalococcoidia bacterium]|nr:cupredoxin domain-containing protein [Dehalococcoidia bacterium]
MRGEKRTAAVAAAIALVAIVLAALAAACGQGGGEEMEEEETAPPPTQVTVRAVRALKWERTKLTVAAGQPVTFTFVNEDSGVPHDLVIYRDSARTQPIARTEQCTAPCQEQLQVTLPPGKYYFNCSIHPVEMKGEIEAK